jgi:TolB protein
MSRRYWIVALSLVLVGSTIVAALSFHTTAREAQAGQQLPRTALPWASIDANWTLVMGTSEPARQGGASGTPPFSEPHRTRLLTLFAVDPEGGRYLIHRFALKNPDTVLTLVDWSHDKTYALLVQSTNYEHVKMVLVNLTSGKLSSFGVGNCDANISYVTLTTAFVSHHTDDIGFVCSNSHYDATLEGFTPTGTPLPHLFPPAIKHYFGFGPRTPDGPTYICALQCAVEDPLNRVELRNIQGRVVYRSDPQCSTISNFWSRTQFVEGCNQQHADGDWGSLFLKTVGGASQQLTVWRDPLAASFDVDDQAAYRIQGVTVTQSAGACGFFFVGRVHADKSVSPVSLGAARAGMTALIEAPTPKAVGIYTSMSCGTGSEFLWYHPTTGRVVVAVGPPVTKGGVTDIAPYH